MTNQRSLSMRPRDYYSRNFEKLIKILARTPHKFLPTSMVRKGMYAEDSSLSPAIRRRHQKRLNKVVTNAIRHGWVSRGKVPEFDIPALQITRAGISVLGQWAKFRDSKGTRPGEDPTGLDPPGTDLRVIRCPICGDKYPVGQFEDLAPSEIREFKCLCGVKLETLIRAAMKAEA